MQTECDRWSRTMREDWDRRAREDAEYFIYTRSSEEELDFERSGEANYNQLVRPFAPMLLNGRPARECAVVEIGCGAGRMTQWFARNFGTVRALDVSPEMIALAQRRLSQAGNVRFDTISGADLEPVPSESADLVFSYIVFQHIPSRDAIANLFREAGRVLRRGGKAKIQVNGDQSEAYRTHERDTWLGETFSAPEALELLRDAGLTPVAMEGAGTQYFTLTSCKGAPPARGTCVLAGEPWSADYLAEGFGAAVDSSWRPVEARARMRFEGTGSRVYAGMYFWPESCRHTLRLDGRVFEVHTPGDHYFESEWRGGEVELAIDPAPARPPAFRVTGIY